MTSKLSAQSKERYREFQGQVVEQMPLLLSGKNEKGEVVDVPRDPASFAYIIERRETAPEDMHRKYTPESFFTGDTVSRGVNGDLVSTWDSPILRTVTPESRLVNGALKLSTVQWNELRTQKDGTLYLSADEVEELHGLGYVKKEGVWTPENTSIAKVCEHLSRGRDLKGYFEMVADAMPDCERIMRVCLYQTEFMAPTLRSWVAGRFSSSSVAGGTDYLNEVFSRLIGIASKA